MTGKLSQWPDSPAWIPTSAGIFALFSRPLRHRYSSRDFKNLIAALAGGNTLIERRTADPRIVEVARNGDIAAGRGELIADKLLGLARRRERTAELVATPRFLADIEPLIRQAARDAVSVTIDCVDDSCDVSIDPVDFEAALTKLTANARGAMQAGGRLRIAARVLRSGSTPLRAAAFGFSSIARPERRIIGQ